MRRGRLLCSVCSKIQPLRSSAYGSTTAWVVLGWLRTPIPCARTLATRCWETRNGWGRREGMENYSGFLRHRAQGPQGPNFANDKIEHFDKWLKDMCQINRDLSCSHQFLLHHAMFKATGLGMATIGLFRPGIHGPSLPERWSLRDSAASFATSLSHFASDHSSSDSYPLRTIASSSSMSSPSPGEPLTRRWLPSLRALYQDGLRWYHTRRHRTHLPAYSLPSLSASQAYCTIAQWLSPIGLASLLKPYPHHIEHLDPTAAGLKLPHMHPSLC